jgi:hypothetical protein
MYKAVACFPESNLFAFAFSLVVSQANLALLLCCMQYLHYTFQLQGEKSIANLLITTRTPSPRGPGGITGHLVVMHTQRNDVREENSARRLI